MHNNNNDKKWAEDMIEEIAEVKTVGQGYAEILPSTSGGCSSCSSNSSCSSASDTFNFFTGSKAEPHTIRVPNPVYAKPGDKVVVGVRANTVLKGSLLAYLLPLITLLIFAMLGELLFSQFSLNAEVGSILFGLLGLYVGFQIIAGLFKNSVSHSAMSNHFEATILRVVEPDLHPVAFSLS